MLGRSLMAALLLAPQPALAAQVRGIVPVRTGFALGNVGAAAGSWGAVSAPLPDAPLASINISGPLVPLMPSFAAMKPLPITPASPQASEISVVETPIPLRGADAGAIAQAPQVALGLRHFPTQNYSQLGKSPLEEEIASPKIIAAARASQATGLKTLASFSKNGAAPGFAVFFDQSRPHAPSGFESPIVAGRWSNSSNLLAMNSEDSSEPSFSLPQPPEPHPPSGLGIGAVHYTIYLSLLQIGLGVYTPIWPGLAMERFGTANYGLASSLAVLSMPVAAYFGKWMGARFGVKNGLAASLIGTAAALTLVFGAFGIQALSWGGLLAGLIAVQGLFALMRTLDRGVPTAIYGRDQSKIQKFNGVTFAVSRIPGILVPMAVGGLVGTLGTFGTLGLFPLALLAAVPFILLLKTKDETSSGPPANTGAGDDRLLHLAGFGFASQQIMTYVVPFIVASAWGAFANPGDPLAAKSAAGILMGFWTLGTLLGTLHLLGAFRWLAKKSGRNMPAAGPRQKLRMAALIGALGFLGYFPLMLTLPWAAYLAMIPAGFAGAYSFLVYLSAAQASAPSDRSGVVARYMIYSFAVVAAAVWGIAALIQAFPGSFIPFAALAAGLALLGAANFYIYKKLP